MTSKYIPTQYQRLSRSLFGLGLDFSGVIGPFSVYAVGCGTGQVPLKALMSDSLIELAAGFCKVHVPT